MESTNASSKKGPSLTHRAARGAMLGYIAAIKQRHARKRKAICSQ